MPGHPTSFKVGGTSVLRAPLSTISELEHHNGASTTRRKVLAAVRDANTGRPRVASQTKQNKTKQKQNKTKQNKTVLWAGKFFCTFGIECCNFLAADSGSQRARRRGRLRVLRDLGLPPLATQRSFRNLARKILKGLSADCPSSNVWSNRIKASSSITDVC